MRYILIIAALFCSLPQIFAQNNITYGAGISYTNGAPSFVPPARTSRVAIDTITGKWYHFNTPGGWQLLGNTIEEIAGCSAPAYTPTKGDSKVVINNCAAPELYYWTGSAWVWINEGATYYAGEGIRIENDTIILDSLKLNELHDVFVPNPINNQVLTWDNIDKRWEAKTVADSSATNELQTLSTTGAAGNISISSGNTITLNVNDADSSPTNELQTLSVVTNTATLSSGGGSVTIAGAGINTVGTAGTTITVTGTEVDGSVSNELQTLSTGTNTLTLSNGGGTVTVDTDPANDVTGSGTSGQVSFWTGAQTQSGDNGLWWDNSLKRLGVGSTSPTAPLFVKSTGNSSSTNIAVQFQNSQPVTPLNIFTILDNGNVGLGGQTSPTSRLDILGGLRLGTTTVQFGFGESGGNSIFLGSLTNHPYRFVVNTNEAARFTTGNNFLIGNTTGTARLHVVGAGSTSSTWAAQFHNSAGNNNALMIRNDGNVGVGTSSPIAKLHIEGNVYVPTGSQFRGGANGNTAGMSFWGTTDGNTGWGGFMGRNMLYDGTNYIYATTNSSNLWGTVAGIWVNGRKDSDSGRALRFIARPNTEEGNDVVSTSADRNLYTHLSIGYDGIVSVGTVAPNASAKFEVASTTQGVLFPRMTTTQRNAIATPADGLVIYNTTDNKLQVRAGGAWVDLH
jgi:hypothetical protein